MKSDAVPILAIDSDTNFDIDHYNKEISTTEIYTTKNQFYTMNETLLKKNNTHKEINTQTYTDQEQLCTSKSLLEIENQNIKQTDNFQENPLKKER